MDSWFVPPTVVPLLFGAMVVAYGLWRAFT